MKKLLIALLIAPSISFGQLYGDFISQSSSTFFGVNNNSPSSTIDLYQSYNSNLVSINNVNLLTLNSQDIFQLGLPIETVFNINANGILKLKGTISLANTISQINANSTGFGTYRDNNNFIRIWTKFATGPQIVWKSNSTGTSANFEIAYDGSSSPSMSFNPDGRIGIGSNNMAAGYLLSVEGKIMAENVTVKLQTDWPDYVFGDNYDLMSYSQLRNYIATYKHLPNMPSAEEVMENGIDLAEQNAALLRQVEELTLRLLEIEERLQELE